MDGNAENLPDGLYFGMEESRYHSLPMVSSHDVKQLLISPLDYWEQSWMNPAPDDEETEEDTFARMLGRAYHARILEGVDALNERFAPKLVCPKDTLDTADELRAVLREMELPVGGNKPILINRLLDAKPDIKIKAVLEESYAEQHKGKGFLDQKYLSRIARAAAMIEQNPHISKCFTGGYAEVVVIWTKDGVQRRARLDYLKPAAIPDLKSFNNKMRRPIKEAITKSIRFDEHPFQAEYYIEAGHYAAEFARDGKITVCSDNWRHKPDEDFLRLLGEQKEDHAFWWVFQQTGRAPVARTYLYNDCHNMRSVARYRIDQAIHVYIEHRDRHGTDGEPWVDNTPPERLSDEDFVYRPDF
jgi:hypothetical protein